MFPRKRLAGLFALLALVGALSVANAHPEELEELEERVSASEVARREHLAHKRHLAARSCAASINAFHASRRAKRSLSEQVLLSGLATNEEAQGRLKESTCVTAPEIEEGPYYVNDELVRTDLVEDQEGVIITLDIGVIDTATCEPVPNAFVEIWSANATGVYGAFETKAIGGPPPGRGGGHGPDDGPRGPPRDRRPPPPDGPGHPGRPDDGPRAPPGDRRPPPPNGPGHPGRPGGPPPRYRRPPGKPGRPGRPGGPGRGPGGPPRGSPGMSSNHTWLRGGYPTDSSGTVSLTTLYPGFYPGRTIHIHTMVHTDWEESPNGTLVSHSGKLRHVGQMFFDESWNDRVLEREPYTLNTARRTKNEDDHDFRRANVDRSSGIVEVEMIGENLDEGLLGFITIGIDMNADYSIHSKNYYNGLTDAD